MKRKSFLLILQRRDTIRILKMQKYNFNNDYNTLITSEILKFPK
jgi:hypothetical protein